MKVSILIGLFLVLLVLWTLRRPEFFQDTDKIKGPPYSAADAAAIVALMPSRMKTAAARRWRERKCGSATATPFARWAITP